MVFTHMDLQSLNLLKPADPLKTNHPGSLKMIDFEYAGINPRAADIANTFCEFCDMNNLHPNYRSQYPSTSIQNEFLRSYIEAADSKFSSSLSSDGDWTICLDTLRLEIERFTLSSHLGWALWSLLQKIESPINFDFLMYASIRLDGFKFFKEKLCPDLS